SPLALEHVRGSREQLALPAVEDARLQAQLLAQGGDGDLVDVVPPEDGGLLLGRTVQALLLGHRGLPAGLAYPVLRKSRSSWSRTPAATCVWRRARSSEARARAGARVESGAPSVLAVQQRRACGDAHVRRRQGQGQGQGSNP